MAQHEAQLRIFLEHRSALIAYAAPIVGSREAAEDIVQEAYVRFAPAKLNGETREQAVAFLYRIVRNLAFDLIKRKKLERRGVGREAPFWVVPQPLPTPEHAATLNDQQRLVLAALAGLPAETRQALELYRFEGRTMEQIAALTDVSVATVHRRIRAAMLAVSLALADGQ